MSSESQSSSNKPSLRLKPRKDVPAADAAAGAPAPAPEATAQDKPKGFTVNPAVQEAENSVERDGAKVRFEPGPDHGKLGSYTRLPRKLDGIKSHAATARENSESDPITKDSAAAFPKDVMTKAKATGHLPKIQPKQASRAPVEPEPEATVAQDHAPPAATAVPPSPEVHAPKPEIHAPTVAPAPESASAPETPAPEATAPHANPAHEPVSIPKAQGTVPPVECTMVEPEEPPEEVGRPLAPLPKSLTRPPQPPAPSGAKLRKPAAASPPPVISGNPPSASEADNGKKLKKPGKKGAKGVFIVLLILVLFLGGGIAAVFYGVKMGLDSFTASVEDQLTDAIEENEVFQDKLPTGKETPITNTSLPKVKAVIEKSEGNTRTVEEIMATAQPKAVPEGIQAVPQNVGNESAASPNSITGPRTHESTKAEPNPDVVYVLGEMHVTGVFVKGNKAKMMVDGKVFDLGDEVSNDPSVAWVGFRRESNTLVFRDAAGVVYTKRF